MSDLDTRLRSLTELSPPSRAPLGADELHQRANRVQRRSFAMRAVPAAVVVIALLAGAVALRSEGATTDVVVGPPDTPVAPDRTVSSELGERDQQLVGFLMTAAELRHHLDREALLTAVVASKTGADVGELQTQRQATDDALARYEDQVTTVDPAEGSAVLADALAQANNRLERIGVVRTSVDRAQADAYANLEAYANTAAAVAEVPRQFLVEVDEPDLFRGVLTASNLGTYGTTAAAWTSWLTVAIEVGYYPEVVPTGADPTTERGACSDDAAGAGDRCAAYARALGLHTDGDQAMSDFQRFASGRQKQIFRAADAGGDHDELTRAAFEDGVGINDLRGTASASIPIDPTAWRTAALGHLDHLADAERQLYDLILDPVEEPAPPSTGSGSSLGTTATTAGP